MVKDQCETHQPTSGQATIPRFLVKRVRSDAYFLSSGSAKIRERKRQIAGLTTCGSFDTYTLAFSIAHPYLTCCQREERLLAKVRSHMHSLLQLSCKTSFC
jgi:hypothetical protein